MKNTLSPTLVRKNFFKILDEVSRTKSPKFIKRGEGVIKISVESCKYDISSLIKPCEDLVNEDIASSSLCYWNEEKFSDI